MHKKSNKSKVGESTQVVQSMIEETRFSIYQDRLLYFMWGYLTLACALTHYVFGYLYEYSEPYRVWAFMFVGAVVHIIYLVKKRKTSQVRTYMGRVMAGIWGGMGLAVIAVLFSANEIGWSVIYPICMILYGTASYATGMTLQFKPMIWAGLVSAICGCWAFYQPFQYQLLLLMAVIIISYLIPVHLVQPKHEDVREMGNT